MLLLSKYYDDNILYKNINLRNQFHQISIL